MKPHTILVFPSRLGWMAVVTAGVTIKQLTFGHPTAATARAALSPELSAGAIPGGRDSPLARRLQAYASGTPDDFRDIRIDPGPLGEFQRRVLNQCRRVPRGSTISYAELAAKAGFPGAARAVGNCMAANRVPLMIPCHRVVRSDGRLGSYSAPGGTKMKRRLLVLESAEKGGAGKGGQDRFAGTARRVLRTKRSCPPFPARRAVPAKRSCPPFSLA